jgi:hypothetical protein
MAKSKFDSGGNEAEIEFGQRFLQFSPQSSRLLSKNIQIGIFKTIILPVVLYGCETWSLTLREEHRLRVLEIRLMGRIFGPKRVEVIGGCRELYNEKLYSLYSSPSKIRMIKSKRMRWSGHVARMGEKRHAYRILVRKPEVKNH